MLYLVKKAFCCHGAKESTDLGRDLFLEGETVDLTDVRAAAINGVVKDAVELIPEVPLDDMLESKAS